MSVYLLRLEALDEADNPTTLRFATGYYADPQARLWEPRIQQPGLYRAGLYAGDLLPAQRSGYGETTLINSDGQLDYLADYAVDGREAVLFLVDDSGAVTEQLRGTISRLGFERNLVSVKLRDPIEPLQQPHPHETYAGDNVLPDGLEGTEDDIAGRTKPRLYGEVRNASPVLVNSAKLIYQISDQDCAVQAVYDQGTELTSGGNYASLSDLQSTAPSPGEWRSFEGYLRLGSSPAGTVTADADANVVGAGSVMAAIASDAGFTLASGDIAALDALGAVRMWVDSDTTTAALLDDVATSIGGYWRIDSTGELRAAQWAAPGAPKATLQDHQILSISRAATGSGEGGLPVWRVTLQADRIETTQTDLAGSVSPARRARLAQDARAASAENPATRTRHPLAAELEINSRLGSRSAAQARCFELLALVDGRRDLLTVEAMIGDASPLTIADTVRIMTPLLGYENGRNLRVIGRTFDAARQRITLDLWG